MANPIGRLFFEGVLPFLGRTMRSMFGAGERKFVSQESVNAAEQGLVRDAVSPPLPKAAAPAANPYPAPEGVLKPTTVTTGTAPGNVSGNFGYMGQQTRFGAAAAAETTEGATATAASSTADVAARASRVKPVNEPARGRNVMGPNGQIMSPEARDAIAEVTPRAARGAAQAERTAGDAVPGDGFRHVPASGELNRNGFMIQDRFGSRGPGTNVIVRPNTSPVPYAEVLPPANAATGGRALATRPPVLEGELLPAVRQGATPSPLPQANVIDHVAGPSRLGRAAAIGSAVATATVGVGVLVNGMTKGAGDQQEAPPVQQQAQRDPELPDGMGYKAYAKNHARRGDTPKLAASFNKTTQLADKLLDSANLLTDPDTNQKRPLSESQKYAAATLGPQRMAYLEALRVSGIDKPLSEISAALKNKTQRDALFVENPDLKDRLTAIAKESGSLHVARNGDVKWNQVAAMAGNTRFAGKIEQGDSVTPQSLLRTAKAYPERIAAAEAAAQPQAAEGATTPPPAARQQPARQAQTAPTR